MMEPKQKAKELIEKFAPAMPNEHWEARAIDCALICINEIELAISTTLVIVDKRMKNEVTDDILSNTAIPYWDEVINELMNYEN